MPCHNTSVIKALSNATIDPGMAIIVVQLKSRLIREQNSNNIVYRRSHMCPTPLRFPCTITISNLQSPDKQHQILSDPSSNGLGYVCCAFRPEYLRDAHREPVFFIPPVYLPLCPHYSITFGIPHTKRSLRYMWLIFTVGHIASLITPWSQTSCSGSIYLYIWRQLPVRNPVIILKGDNYRKGLMANQTELCARSSFYAIVRGCADLVLFF